MVNETVFVPVPDSTATNTFNSGEPTIEKEDLTEEQDPEFMDIVKIEQPDTPEVSDVNEYDSDTRPKSKRKTKKRLRRTERDGDYVEMEDDESTVSENRSQVLLTSQDLDEWRDVIKMEEYMVNGSRPHFWEEGFTKRVLEAIKNKDLEMKKAASLLGVSYGTLYGRYREVYGCLKEKFK